MSSEVQRRIDLLAEQLGRSVVLNDPSVRLVYASQHYGDEDPVRIKGVLNRDPGSDSIAHVLAQGIDTWSGPGRIPAAPQLSMLGRLAIPVRWHGELLGTVMVIDADESLTSDETAQLDEFAHDVAGLIVAERHDADQRAIEDEQDVDAWLCRIPGEQQRGRLALVARGLLPDLEHVRVFVADVPEQGPTDRARTLLALRHAFGAVRGRFRGTPLSTVREGHGALAIVTRLSVGDTEANEIAEMLIGEIRQVVGLGRPLRLGVGAEAAGVAAAWRSRRQADLAARAVAVRNDGAIAHWAELGVLQLLTRIPIDEMDATFVPDPVAALLAADPQGRLIETLTRYLHSGGAGSATADALHIHRTTLYYRLDQIRKITRLDVDDGDVRLLLQLGLLAHRMQERLVPAQSGR